MEQNKQQVQRQFENWKNENKLRQRLLMEQENKKQTKDFEFNYPGSINGPLPSDDMEAYHAWLDQ